MSNRKRELVDESNNNVIEELTKGIKKQTKTLSEIATSLDFIGGEINGSDGTRPLDSTFDAINDTLREGFNLLGIHLKEISKNYKRQMELIEDKEDDRRKHNRKKHIYIVRDYLGKCVVQCGCPAALDILQSWKIDNLKIGTSIEYGGANTAQVLSVLMGFGGAQIHSVVVNDSLIQHIIVVDEYD